MSSLPSPLDNIFVLIAVILGVVLLLFAIKKNSDASKRLDAARKEKARVIREVKFAAKNKEE